MKMLKQSGTILLLFFVTFPALINYFSFYECSLKMDKPMIMKEMPFWSITEGPRLHHSNISSCSVELIGGDSSRNMYGAWPVCTKILTKNPLIYSFGIGGDVSFDIGMRKRYNASIFCYDPTINRERFEAISRKTSGLYFQQFGLGSHDGVINFYKSENPKIGSMVSTPNLKGYKAEPAIAAPVLTLSSLIAINKHSWIDIVKIDIEGEEFNIFKTMDLAALRVSQVLIEFHARFYDDGWQAQRDIYQKFKVCGWTLVHESVSKEEVVFVRSPLRSVLM